LDYLCLIYADEARVAGLPAGDRAAIEAECLVYEEALRGSGHLLAVQALQPARTATTLRVRAGQVSLAGGPAAGRDEQLAGFYLIAARDLNDAIRLAARIPPARLGSVEVRPVRQLPPPGFGVPPISPP
jgi:hypothetical protein